MLSNKLYRPNPDIHKTRPDLYYHYPTLAHNLYKQTETDGKIHDFRGHRLTHFTRAKLRETLTEQSLYWRCQRGKQHLCAQWIPLLDKPLNSENQSVQLEKAY